MNNETWTQQNEAELQALQERRKRYRERVDGSLSQAAQTVYGEFFALDFIPQNTSVEDRIKRLGAIMEKNAHRIRTALAPFDEGPEAVEG